MLKFFGYKKCETSRKAEKFLSENEIEYFFIDLIEHPPTTKDLRHYWKKSGEPLKKFFNSSGVEYRNANLKKKLPNLSEEEMLELLASSGKLIKRPIVTNGTNCTVGFHKEIFEKTWLDSK